MAFLTLLLLAISLSADAFAVAVGTGISQRHIRSRDALQMAFSFGFFQAIMPIIGFAVASLFAEQIMDYDHWIAFLLLGYIGANMIHEWWSSESEWGQERDVFSIRSLIVLGVATSIDALAVGVSLTASVTSIYFPALMIGVITFVLSWVGIEFGKKWWAKIWKNAEIVGGLILIGIGTKILIEHLITW
jgi:putative Mn2+ efflux pump MntP